MIVNPSGYHWEYFGTPSGGRTTLRMASIKLSFKKWSEFVVVESEGDAFTYIDFL